MPTHDWTDARLDELRHIMDPPADAAVAAILQAGELESINALMRTLTHNDAPVPEQLPAPVRDYFERTAALPAWADPERIAAGERVFMRYGLQAMQALMYRSLPESYANADGAVALASTGRMTALANRRVLETLHFTIDVMTPGGLGPDGRGVRSAQRVRLLHAAIRAHLLAAEMPGWDPALGRPINQEDLLATLGAFSVLVVDSLARFGIDLTRAEQDAFVHCWRVVGYFMGVREHALFDDLDHGLALWQRIRARHHRRSDAGVALTRALLEFADELVPGEWADGINPTMLRFLCGDAVADLLEVPAADWTRVFIGGYRRLVGAADELQDLGPVTRWVGERFGVGMCRALLGHSRAGARPDFDIPAGLRDSWRL